MTEAAHKLIMRWRDADDRARLLQVIQPGLVGLTGIGPRIGQPGLKEGLTGRARQFVVGCGRPQDPGEGGVSSPAGQSHPAGGIDEPAGPIRRGVPQPGGEDQFTGGRLCGPDGAPGHSPRHGTTSGTWPRLRMVLSGPRGGS